MDGRILSEHADISFEKLLDGCVCCSKKSELADCLKLMLQEQPDVLFIELTGVANQVLGMQVITLLDAEHVLEYNSIFSSDRQLVRTLRRQIEVANKLIVNKTDLVHPKRLGKIENVIQKQNERAEIVYTTQSQIDAASLLAAIAPNENRRTGTRQLPVLNRAAPLPADKQHEHHHPRETDSYSQIQTITLPFPSDQWISKKQLEQFLYRWNEQLVRAKGYVQLEGREALELMQYAGKRVSWEPSNRCRRQRRRRKIQYEKKYG